MKRVLALLILALAMMSITPAALSQPKDRAAACTTADEGDNAHPSGKDRSCEQGANAGPEEDGDDDHQGTADSDPDARSNGGKDKPSHAGGADRDDQDGNNGCGNDDDFEDDNNGNCVGKPQDSPTPSPTRPPETTPPPTCGSPKGCGPTDIVNPCTDCPTDTELDTQRIGAVLPETGVGKILLYVIFAILLIGAGIGFWLRGRTP